MNYIYERADIMRLVIAPDSFKGSLSSKEIIEIVSRAAKKHFHNLDIIMIPVADGGEGTLEALLTPVDGKKYETVVTGPLKGKVKAEYGIYNDTLIIEMAQASGLTLVDEDKRNPLKTTSYGTGELIKKGLDLGFRKIILGIGGSATNDGGMGALAALGVRFLSKDKTEIFPSGEGLIKLDDIDIEGLDKRLEASEITVMCDVNNPLTGTNGATMVYGPQKGADTEKLKKLETGMCNYRDVVINKLGINLDNIKGAGAAGGIGGALMAVCGAKLKPGIEILLDFVDFDSILETADLVVTGEGKIDIQSTYGKVIQGISKRCKARGVPVVVVCGGIDGYTNDLYELGIQSIMPITRKNMDLRYAMENAPWLLEDACDRMFRFINLSI